MDQKVLKGVRVVDFCEFVAGPYATNTLAAMGADVIKIESNQYLGMRALLGPDLNASPTFNSSNHGKSSVQLNLKHPTAIELAKKIVEKSDIVLENMRTGKMASLGLSYDELKKVQPELIMVSSSGYGQAGPYSKFGGYALTFACHCGLAAMTGHSESRPCNYGIAVDLWSAKQATIAIMVALIHKQRTSEGQFVDLAQWEGLIPMIGEATMDYVMNGRIPDRQGNKDKVMAPHDCYRCKGDDKWVSIAVADDTEWAALCKAISQPELKEDKRFSDRYTRWTNQKELDEIITEWTLERSPEEATDILQKAGIAAMPVFDALEMLQNEHFRSRGLAQPVKYGDREDIAVSMPFRYGKEAIPVQRAPLFGEHNYKVLGELLGLSKKEIDSYIEDKVIY